MQWIKGKGKLVAAIICMQLITMGAVNIASALAQIAAAFPDKSPETIQQLLAIPSLATIPASLVAPFIADKIGRKRTITLGLVIFLAAGLVPAFMGDWSIMMASRVCIGIAAGFVNPLNTACIFEFFPEKEAQDTVLGWQQVGNSGGNVIVALACGYLTLISWRMAFLVHLIGVISLVAVLLWFPADKKVEKVRTGEKAAQGKRHLTLACIFWLLVVFVFEGTLHTFSMNLAFLVEEVGVGGSVLAGYGSTMMTVGGVLSGLVYGKVASLLKRWTLSFGILLCSITMFLLYIMKADNAIFVWIGGFLLGFGMVIVFSTCTALAVTNVNLHTQALVSAIFICAINLSQSVNPWWGSFLTNTFSDGSFAGKFIGAGVVLVILVVLTALTVGRVKAKESDLAAE